MRPFTSTISFDDAIRTILKTASPVAATERVALSDLDGRILAEAIVADQDVPAFDRAAMDGYAVRSADLATASREARVTLRVAGQVFTGDEAPQSVAAGHCVAVSTGAPLPPGADAVVMVEHTTGDGDHVVFERPSPPRQHVGPRGSDMRAGEAVLEVGTALTPGGVGAIAALGRTDALVFARPRVAIMCTGDEVVSPGVPLAAGQVYNVNRYTLESVVRRHGGHPVVVPTTGDTLEALHASLAAAGPCDLVVSSGGSSVGEHDLVIDVLRAQGEVLFHGVNIKPGKPTVFGRIGSILWLGLSGYPSSCLSNAYVMLVPLLRRLGHLPVYMPRIKRMPLARAVRSAAGRLQFYQVRFVNGQAEPAFKASGDITSMAHADGYITIDAEVESLDAGTLVDVVFYD